MDEQDRVSQASSVVTISSFPVRPQTGEEKVQTFGKRCYAVKRDPNCPVVIRGWLYKKDSTGLKLWKRRWFVLSEYCLFYYKDSREETVLGSIPLPSYSVLFCTPRECKNRKYTFKVVHKGMRTYFFSADTQEDMLGWVRAISQSASMDTESTINKRCSSYQDFTQVDSSEFVHTLHNTSLRDVQSSKKTEQDERAELKVENGGRKKAVQRSKSSSKEHTDESSLPFLAVPQYFPLGPQSLSSRTQLDSRPHTPVGRVDIRPHNDLPPIPPTNKQTIGTDRHTHKGSVSSQLPPLPTSRLSPNLGNPHYQSLRSHSYLCQHLPTLSEKYDGFQGSEIHSSKTSDNHVDAVLTKLCGCDKQLQALCAELSHLQVEKESLQAALEVSHIQRDECKYTEAQMNQKAMLQDELVTIRARICDVSADMDYVWCQYERMESELAVFRSQLQHVCHYGPLQGQHKAQKQLWMIEDILCGLRDNRNHYRLVLGLHDQPGEELPGHNLEVEMEAPFLSHLTHDVWASPNMCKASRCDSHIYSKPYSCNPEQKQGDWNQGNRIHTWPSADPFVNATRMSNIYKKDCIKETQEQDQIQGMKTCEETNAVHREASVSKPSVAELDPCSFLQEATALPLRVTRVITATLPSALIAHRVSVQDPPLDLVNPLPEQIPQMLPKRAPCKPSQMSSEYTGIRLQEENNEMTAQRLARITWPRNGMNGRAPLKHRSQSTPLKEQKLSQEVDGDAHPNGLNDEKRNQTSDLDLRPEQREAKLKRVERIRQRVIRSVSKENQAVYLPTNPILQKTKDSESEVIQSVSSNIHTGDAENSEKSVDTFQKHQKHEINPSLLARTPSLSGQNTALSNGVDLTDKSPPSNNNRSEWFLSTCEWQGFKPLVDSGLNSFPHNYTTECEVETLSGNSTQKSKNSANKQFNSSKMYTSEAKPRSKKNRAQLLNEASECKEKNKGTGGKLCDIASVPPVSMEMTPCCDGKSDGSIVTKNHNELPNDLVKAPASSDKCMTSLHRQLELELSVYEEIPKVEFSSLTTEDREHEKQEQKHKLIDGVRENVMEEKNACRQNETVLSKPESSRSQNQVKSNASVYCTVPANGLEKHTPFLWSKVTMDRTSL